MRMGIGGWIGLIVGGLGGLIGMTVAIMASPVFGSVFALIFIVIFGGMFWSFFFKPMMTRNKLAKTGVPAQARIVSLADTGVTINMNPQIKLTLEVTPPMGAPYMVETKQVISRLDTASYQPGTILPVIVDPNDKNLIEINYDSSAQTAGYSSGGYAPGGVAQATDKILTGPYAGMSAADANAMIAKNNEENIQLMSYGTESKAIVTKYTWLGVYVNGENPFVEVEVEVMPSSGTPYKAKAQGVVQTASVPKYQPGAEIYIKYDPNNPNKITMFHST
jgi:archaellin